MKKADSVSISAGFKIKDMNQKGLYLVIVILCFIVYGNSISNHYSMDDELVTLNNQRIMEGIKGIPGIWSTFYSEGKLKYEYRPVVKTTFAIEYQFFGQNPHVSHLINILLYAITVILIYKILKKLFADYSPLLAFITVLIFIVHPVHSEVVDSIKNRDEILSFLGCIVTLWFLIRNADTSKIKYLIYAFLSYVLAYFSKSSAIVFVAIFPLVLYFYGKTSLKKIGLIFLLILIAMLAARFFPKTILPPANRAVFFFENPLYYYPAFTNKISIGLLSLLFYVKILIIPHPLVFYYGYNMIPILPLSNPYIITSAIIYLALFIYALFGIKKRTVLSFSILYFLITISMFSNIVKPAMGIVAERFVYAASLGFCIAIAYLILKILKIEKERETLTKKKLVWVIIPLFIILIPFSAGTIIRNPDWNTHMSLYRHDIVYLKNSAKANAMIANQIFGDANESLSKGVVPENLKEKADSIIEYYLQSIKVLPTNYSSYNNIGNAYISLLVPFENDSFRRGELYSKAIYYFKEAIKCKPRYFDALCNLGNTYEKMGQYRNASNYYWRSLTLNPNFLSGWSNLANMYNDYLGSMDTAIMINEHIIKKFPDSDVSYVNIGTYYLMKSDSLNAVKYFELASDKVPSNNIVAGLLFEYFKNKDEIKADKYRIRAGIQENKLIQQQ